MLSSPRRPSSTMRIFSSAEGCRRVALRISRTVFSALSGMRLLACLIVAPQRGYDEPATLSYAISSFCPTSADGLQRFHPDYAPGQGIEKIVRNEIFKEIWNEVERLDHAGEGTRSAAARSSAAA